MKYILVLILISVFDLTLTLIGINNGICKEANPLMKWFIDNWGAQGFIFAKLALFTALPIIIIEASGNLANLSRKKINNYYRFTIIVYVGILSLSILFQFILFK